MTEDDWIVYYSPTEQFGEKTPYRKFTALGRIQSKEPYPFRMSRRLYSLAQGCYIYDH